MTVRLSIVIPTRKRPDLCRVAIASAIDQIRPGVSVVVSENSGPGSFRSELVAALPPHVELLEPERELPMPEHWDWALRQVELRVRPTHVAFLTDRMIFRDGSLPLLIELIESHPDEVISYNHDRIDDWNPQRVRLEANSGDGRVYVIDSRSLLRMTASGRPYLWPLPRMLNCVVPVEVFSTMRSSTGHVFSSASPDFYFAYRLLALRDEFLCLNYSLVAHQGSRRSNGQAVSTGIVSGDAQDFRTRLTLVGRETPFPDVNTIGNAVFHEYSVVRNLTKSDRFPPLDKEGVRSVLLGDADAMINRDLGASIRSRLAEGGTLAVPRPIGRRLKAVIRQPFRVLGWRLPYRRLPLRAAVLFQPFFPGGVFGSVGDAIVVAKATPRPTLQAPVPPGAVGTAARVLK